MNGFLFLSLGATIGCGFADKAAVESLPGTYESEATWDLGAVFRQNQSMSQNLADLFISHVVSSFGAPSSIEKELEEAVSGAIRGEVSSMIEGHIPAELNSNSTLLSALSSDLATIRVESDLELIHEQDELFGLDKIVGRETIHHLVLDTQVGALDIPIEELSENEQQSLIESTYSTTVFQDRMDIADQKISIRYGKLLTWAFEEKTGINPDELIGEVANELDCTAFVDQITNTVGIPSVTVAGQTYTIDVQIFSTSCSKLDSDLTTNSFGMFPPDADLLVSGPAAMIYESDGGPVSTIQSADGYGGEIDDVPSIFSTMLDLSFSATRISD